MTTTNEHRETIERLKKISLFKTVRDDPGAMDTIAELFRTISCRKGRDVLTEGEFGDELYIIKNGTVEVRKRTLHGDTYTVTHLSAEQNIFFGEVALLDPDKRSATVTCTTDCEFYVLTREKFVEMGDKNPALGLNVTRELLRIICNRLRKANADIITLFGALVEEVSESGGLED